MMTIPMIAAGGMRKAGGSGVVARFRGPGRGCRVALAISVACSIVGSASPTFAQSPEAVRAVGNARSRSLDVYTGVYDYSGGMTVIILPADTVLLAIIDEAKYPLRSIGDDRFLNVSNDTIPFRRAADGSVSGFEEHKKFYPRRSNRVDPAIASLLRPRPPAPDGRRVRYTYVRPAQLDDGFSVTAASDIGLDPAIVSGLVNRVLDGTYPDIHGILVYRHGKLAVEEYFYGYDRGRPHQMRSASKSIVSALAGLAIDRGALSGVGDTVLRRAGYPDVANPDPRKSAITLRDLLTMRSGLACDDWDGSSPGNESRVMHSGDWAKYVLDLPMLEAPGQKGHYCSGNVFITGRIIERATGMPLPSFAQRELFGPLGIEARDVRWNFTLSASNAATIAQLYLRPRDILKLGVLFQQHGVWHGRQVISRQWVEESTSKASMIGDEPYGYFWWHKWMNVVTTSGKRRVDMVVATGNGGQKLYLVPSLDLIVVLTGGNYNTERSPSTEIMARELLPAFLDASDAKR